MDAKKLLMSVATTAVGFAFGLYLGKMIMKGTAKSTPAPAPTAAAEFGYDDDANDY